jgi:hypothetical protein
MQAFLIQSAIFIMQRVLSTGLVADIERMALELMTLPKNPGELSREYNDRRKYMVIDFIKGEQPKVRTALIDATLGLIVAKLS